MNITLKNVKLFLAGSQETTCFVASVYVDGKKVGTAENSGHGGPNMVRAPREILDRMEAYCRALPRVDYGFDVPEGSSKDFQPDLDYLIGSLVQEHARKADEKRLAAKFARLDAKEKARLVAMGCKTVIRIDFKDGRSLWIGTRGDDVAGLVKASETKYGPVDKHVVL